MIIGVDLGYGYTKTSEGIVFPSKISTHETILGEGNMLILDNKAYIVGEGNVEVDLNRINKELTRVCLLEALSKSSNQNDFQVVAGLPLGLFNSQKDQMKQMLLNNRYVEFEVNKQKRAIGITKAEVFPQCLGAHYSLDTIDDTEDRIYIDIGGRTVIIALLQVFNGKRKVTQHSTIYEGTLTLFSKIVSAINSKYETLFEIEDGERILKNGLSIYGEKQEIGFIKNIIEEHTDKIMKELLLKYPVKTAKVTLIGGGAYVLKSLFDKRIPGTSIIPNAQFANALGFKKIGVSLWQRY
ncbi:MAG: ParM/StbA family protein [Clostridia bacterium]|jgi:plasmid segregation protein ParM|nr:ParM/StbA family protein [Clostridia bacterium]